MRHILLRLAPRFDGRWILGLLLVGFLVAAATFVRWGSPVADLEVLVLGPDGQFHEGIVVPAAWADTATVTPDAVVRFPLILGVRNAGYEPARPERLVLSVPARFRLTGQAGEALNGTTDPTTPLIRYTLDPRLGPVEPGRLPTLLPAFETLWLEVVIPRYYCVELADSIPEFVPAPPPPLEAMSRVRLLYALEGGDVTERLTGTVSLELDATTMAVTLPDPPPEFPMERNPELANPDLGPLEVVGSRDVRCGEPESPMELRSTVFEAETGARMITVEYGGAVRKRLFDLNGDGIIDRESWGPAGAGRFVATRRARLPVPGFLLPAPRVVEPDTLRDAMLDPDPLDVDPAEPDSPAPAVPEALPDTLPEPRVRPAQPLGRPVPDGAP
jgi:hypothetical protein